MALRGRRFSTGGNPDGLGGPSYRSLPPSMAEVRAKNNEPSRVRGPITAVDRATSAVEEA
jgi:hypothetical protein